MMGYVAKKDMNQNGRLINKITSFFLSPKNYTNTCCFAHLSSENRDKLNVFHKENFIRIDSMYYQPDCSFAYTYVSD